MLGYQFYVKAGAPIRISDSGITRFALTGSAIVAFHGHSAALVGACSRYGNTSCFES